MSLAFPFFSLITWKYLQEFIVRQPCRCTNWNKKTVSIAASYLHSCGQPFLSQLSYLVFCHASTVLLCCSSRGWQIGFVCIICTSHQNSLCSNNCDFSYYYTAGLEPLLHSILSCYFGKSKQRLHSLACYTAFAHYISNGIKDFASSSSHTSVPFVNLDSLFPLLLFPYHNYSDQLQISGIWDVSAWK